MGDIETGMPLIGLQYIWLRSDGYYADNSSIYIYNANIPRHTTSEHLSEISRRMWNKSVNLLLKCPAKKIQ